MKLAWDREPNRLSVYWDPTTWYDRIVIGFLSGYTSNFVYKVMVKFKFYLTRYSHTIENWSLTFYYLHCILHSLTLLYSFSNKCKNKTLKSHIKLTNVQFYKRLEYLC